MSNSFKKLLFAGTALVAVSAASAPAHAIAVFTNTATAITSGASGTWAESTIGVSTNATHADIAHAGAGDSVNLVAGATLTVTNDGTAGDGSDALGNVFVVGDVTNTLGTGNITLTQADTKLLQTTTINSANIGGNFIQTTAGGGTPTNKSTATVTGALTVGGTVTLTNNNVSAGVTSSLTAGSMIVTGATGVLSKGFAANEQALIVNGNSQFTGAVTLTSVTGTANNAILTLKGATNVATAGIAMVEGAASFNKSALNFAGTTAQTLSGGDISTGTAAVGIIQVNNSAGVTINNTVGVTGGLALAVNVNKGAGNSSATFTNTVNAPITLGGVAGTVAGVTYGTAALTDVNTVTFDSSTQSFTVTGAIAGTATQTNNVVVKGGKTVTLASASTSNLNNISTSGTDTIAAAADNLTATTLTVGSGSTLKLTGTGKVITGTITNSGTIWNSGGNNALATALTNTGTIFIDATRTLTATLGMVDTSTGTVKIGMAGGTFGVLAEGAGAVDLSHSTVTIAGTAITPGTYAVFTGTAGTGVVPLSLQSAFFTPTATVVGSGVSITIAAKTLAGNQTLATSILGSGAMQTAIGGAGGRAMLAISNAGSSSELDSALGAVRPTVDGSTTTTVVDVGSQVQGVANTRMASLRNGDGLTGMAAGSSANGVSMWLQGYGQTAQQSMRGGVAGYDSDTLGGVIGVDSTRIMNDGVLGVAFNYGRTTADSKNANTTSTTVDNYGFGVYGSHDLGSQMFVNGQVGYSYNKYNSTRHNVLAAGDFANGDYSGNMYSAKLAFGRDYAMDHGLTLTPTVSADYAHLNNDAYTETGTAGGALMNVNSNSYNQFDLGLGVNAGWKFKNADGSSAKPSLHANYTYDASANAIQTTATYTGAVGNAFATSGPTPSRSKFDFGAGIVYSTTANWDLSADYDFSWKEQYTAHNGMLRATSHF